MGSDLGFEGEALQDFVKQHHAYERAECAAERDLERDRIQAEKEKIAAEREKLADRLAQQHEIELAKVSAGEANKER